VLAHKIRPHAHVAPPANGQIAVARVAQPVDEETGDLAAAIAIAKIASARVSP